MEVLIYRPAKSATQSGFGSHHKRWVLEYIGKGKRWLDPLTGYTSGSDTHRQIKLYFNKREDAIAYASRNNLTYRVEPAREYRRLRKNYADNFVSPHRPRSSAG